MIDLIAIFNGYIALDVTTRFWFRTTIRAGIDCRKQPGSDFRDIWASLKSPVWVIHLNPRFNLLPSNWYWSWSRRDGRRWWNHGWHGWRTGVCLRYLIGWDGRIRLTACEQKHQTDNQKDALLFHKGIHSNQLCHEIFSSPDILAWWLFNSISSLVAGKT